MVRVLCPPRGSPDTSVPGVAAPGPSRFTVVCSEKYMVSRRTARPTGPMRRLSTVWAGASARPSRFRSASRTMVPAPGGVANAAPPGPSASERTPPNPSAKRLTLKPLWTYSAWPAIRTVSWPAGGDELCAPGSAPQPSSASTINRIRGVIRVTSSAIATPPRAGRSLPLRPPLRVHPHDRALPRGHPLPARQCFLRRPLHLGRHRGLHLAQLLRRASLFLQVFLVQADGVALAPGLEHLGGERLARLALVVRRVAAHAKRLGDEHGRPLAVAAARGREPGGSVGVEHVVAVEPGSPDAVLRRPFPEVAGEVMLVEPRAERHLVVLQDEDRGDPLDGGEVRGFVRGGGLGRAVPHPRQGDAALAPHLERERHTRDDGHHVTHVRDGLQHAVSPGAHV